MEPPKQGQTSLAARSILSERTVPGIAPLYRLWNYRSRRVGTGAGTNWLELRTAAAILLGTLFETDLGMQRCPRKAFAH